MPVFKNENNGTWYVMARYVNWKGERKQKCKRGFATKKEAQEWERMFQLQNSSDMDMSFEAFIELYMKKTIFEQMSGTYVRCGDYFIPSLTLLEEEERYVGVWGQRHLRYLREHSKSFYMDLLMCGKLNDYLADIEEQAQERFDRIVEQMKQAQGITEQLKEENVWEWIGRMNNIQACAREIVENEILY